LKQARAVASTTRSGTRLIPDAFLARLARPHPGELLLGVLALAAYITICTIGFRVPWTADVGLAYQGGQVAWASGHPESLPTWLSTPFLAMVMALVSRVASVRNAATAATGLNSLIFLAGTLLTWASLRRRIPVWLWWTTLLGFVVYAPIASSIFWVQFNIVALALAAAGFSLAGRRDSLAGLLVALSIGVKPLVILLPVALLWRKDTRRSGMWSVAWGAVLLAASQVFLAFRANDFHALAPFTALSSFSYRALPSTQNGWACNPENYSPLSLWCRFTGAEYWSVKRAVITGAVLLTCVLAASLVSRRPGRSWAIFAFVCMLSPMLSPIAWSHYQILLAPMFLLLSYEYVTAGAGAVNWVISAAAYLLAELTLRPFGTLPGLVRTWLTGKPEPVSLLFNILEFAALAQFVLLVAALIWFSRVPRLTHDERAA
jgi:hypothetical protein